MKKVIPTLYFLLLFNPLISLTEGQEYSKAYPIIGWDSLRSYIERPENYPELLQKAGITGHIYVSLLIDSTGTLSDVEPVSYIPKTDTLKYSMLIRGIKNILSTIKWYPSYSNGKPINDKIYRSFDFILLNDSDKGYNIIAPYIYLKKNH